MLLRECVEGDFETRILKRQQTQPEFKQNGVQEKSPRSKPAQILPDEILLLNPGTIPAAQLRRYSCFLPSGDSAGGNGQSNTTIGMTSQYRG